MMRKLHELKILMKDDPKRAAMLIVLGGVLVLVSARAVFVTAGPKRAAAKGGPDGAAQTSSEAVKTGASVAAALAERSRGEIVTLAVPPKSLRDVFQIDQVLFPAPAAKTPTGVVQEKSESGNAESPEEAALRVRAETERRVLTESQQLRLRGTLLGHSPTAVLEEVSERKSFVLRPGQEIAGFTLVEIGASSVVLEKEGFRVELERAKPEGR
ncbi:MAG: hypothetical protein ACKVZJ_00595 [Phycisphaerales bacterium]